MHDTGASPTSYFHRKSVISAFNTALLYSVTWSVGAHLSVKMFWLLVIFIFGPTNVGKCHITFMDTCLALPEHSPCCHCHTEDRWWSLRKDVERWAWCLPEHHSSLHRRCKGCREGCPWAEWVQFSFIQFPHHYQRTFFFKVLPPVEVLRQDPLTLPEMCVSRLG